MTNDAHQKMKKLLYLLLTLIFTGCCLGNRKCRQSDYSATFRLVSLSSGHDLLFGPYKIYDYRNIDIYTLNGADTVRHSFYAFPNISPDSLLSIRFSYPNEKVYLRLTPLETDSLLIQTNTIDASPCCEDYSTVTPLSYNNRSIEWINGAAILKK